MDSAIKQGFVIGLVVAVAAGYVGWRQGWWPAPAIVAKLTGAPDAVAPAADKPYAKADPGAAAEGVPASPAPEVGKAAPPSAEARPDGSAPSTAAKPSKGGDVAALAPPTQTPPARPSDKAPVEKGVFDVVRVEPTGEAVVAGRCAANCVVELTANGRTHDRATADASGAWAMTPPALPPGDHQLGLKVTSPDGGAVVSEQSVTVSVPRDAKGEVVVVLNEPNAPSKILQSPGQIAAAKPGAPGAAGPARKAAAVAIAAVDAEKGRLFVQGAAPAGAALRVYLNNALIARPVAGEDERWSVRVERGITPGDYVARVDQVETPSGKVIARAEATFSYEGEVAAAQPRAEQPANRPSANTEPRPEAAPKPDGATAPAPGAVAAPPSPQDAQATGQAAAGTPASERSPASEAATQSQAEAGANPVVSSIDTANVRRGDSLWRISRKTYGAGNRYTVIFTANDGQIRNPHLIYPGQVLVLPEDPAKTAQGATNPTR